MSMWTDAVGCSLLVLSRQMYVSGGQSATTAYSKQGSCIKLDQDGETDD
jgi:hypothetical protein